jgi:hypothetical protein
MGTARELPEGSKEQRSDLPGHSQCALHACPVGMPP